jgi:hypothetical protein
MENKSKCVYTSKNPFSWTYVTVINPIENFRGKCDSQIFQISAAKNGHDKILMLRLKKESGGMVPYKIYDEALIRQFMADVVGYSFENPYPQSFMKTENMIDREVEVFYSNENIKGISPVFPQPNLSQNIFDGKLEKLLGLEGLSNNDSNDFGRSDEDQDYDW